MPESSKNHRERLERLKRGAVVDSAREMAGSLEALAAIAGASGNYGVAAMMIDRRTKKIVAMGANSTLHGFSLDNRDVPAHSDGHAEVNVFDIFFAEMAGDKAGMGEVEWREKYNPENYELWVSLEPCLRCAFLIEDSKIATRYVARDMATLDEKGIGQFYPGGRIRVADGILDGAYAGEYFDNAAHEKTARELYESTIKSVQGQRKERAAVLPGNSANIKLLLDSKFPEEKRFGEKLLDALRTMVEDRERKRPELSLKLSQTDDMGYVQYLLSRDGLLRQYDDSLGMKYINRSVGEVHINISMSMDTPRSLAAYLVEKAKISCLLDTKNRKNAVAVVDAEDNIWFTVYDRVGENPVRNALNMAVRTLEEFLAEASRFDDMEDYGHFPPPSRFRFVSLYEPTIEEIASISSIHPGPETIIYLLPDRERGVVSTGTLQQMPAFYRIARGLEDAVCQAEISLGKTIGLKEKMGDITPQEMESAIKKRLECLEHSIKHKPNAYGEMETMVDEIREAIQQSALHIGKAAAGELNRRLTRDMHGFSKRMR